MVLLAVTLGFLGREGFNLWIALAVLLGGWVALGVLRDAWRRTGAGGGSLRWRGLSPSFVGMATAHLGFAAVVLGAVVVTQLNEERDLRMAVGDTGLGGYRFELIEIGQRPGPNYSADYAVFEVTEAGQPIARLTPEKRRYFEWPDHDRSSDRC